MKIRITNCSFESNVATNGSGGALRIKPSDQGSTIFDLIIYDSNFVKNIADTCSIMYIGEIKFNDVSEIS